MRSITDWYYPGGSIVMKRVKHAGTLLFISVNIWIGMVQDALLYEGERMATKSERVLNPSVTVVDGLIEFAAGMLQSLEQDFDKKTLEGYYLPSSDIIRNIKTPIHAAQVKAAQFKKLLSLCRQALGVMEILLWISIAYTSMWLGTDVFLARKKWPSILILILSVPVNFCLLSYLINYSHL